MTNQVRHHITSPSIWTRFLYMLLFSIAYSIAEFVIACTVIFQFFAALFTGRVNEPLLKLGNNLSTYAYQVFQYLTFNSEERPFPFTDWPDNPVGDNVWLREPEVVDEEPAAQTEVPSTVVDTATASDPTPTSDVSPQGSVADDTERDDDQRR